MCVQPCKVLTINQNSLNTHSCISQPVLGLHDAAEGPESKVVLSSSRQTQQDKAREGLELPLQLLM